MANRVKLSGHSVLEAMRRVPETYPEDADLAVPAGHATTDELRRRYGPLMRSNEH